MRDEKITTTPCPYCGGPLVLTRSGSGGCNTCHCRPVAMTRLEQAAAVTPRTFPPFCSGLPDCQCRQCLDMDGNSDE